MIEPQFEQCLLNRGTENAVCQRGKVTLYQIYCLVFQSGNTQVQSLFDCYLSLATGMISSARNSCFIMYSKYKINAMQFRNTPGIGLCSASWCSKFPPALSWGIK